MEIVDSQVINHARTVSGLPRFAMAFDDAYDDAQREAIAVELAIAAMDAVGVDAALWHGEETLCEAAADRAPDRFGGIVHQPDDRPDVEEFVGGLRERPGMLGVRLTPAWPTSGENMARLEAGGYEAWFGAAERHNVPICLFVSGRVQAVDAVARAHPDLVLAIDHLGMPSVPIMPWADDLLDDLPALLDLARHPNVVVKLSGVPALTRAPYPYADLWPAVHRVLEAFGPERTLWGSDYMRCRGLHTYGESVDFVRRSDELSDDEKRLVLGASLRRWFRWPAPARPAVDEGDAAFLEFARRVGGIAGD